MASPKIHPTTYSSPGILGPCPAHNLFTGSCSLPDYFPTNINQAMHTLSLSSPDEHFYMDTVATSHTTHPQGNFLKYFPLKHHHNNHIIVGNGNMIPVQGHGDLAISPSNLSLTLKLSYMPLNSLKILSLFVSLLVIIKFLLI